MYRLVLYYLIGLIGIALAFSLLGLLPYNWLGLLFSVVFLLAVAWTTNWIFAKTFSVVANVESVYISALILGLIINPAKSVVDLPFLFWAAVLTMASKFVVTVYNKHIFNPVALAVFLTSLGIYHSASWWVGSRVMVLPVLIGGVLIVRKIKHGTMVSSFFIASFAVVLFFSLKNGFSPIASIEKLSLNSPWLFFGFVMLTEPLTIPPTNNLRLLYGLLVGFLFAPQMHFGSIYSTPETALLIGNLYSYLVSFKRRLILTLEKKVQVAPDIYDFIFKAESKLNFRPGQYLEWTLGHQNADSRGNRRYFTIASSPTEDEIRIGVKFYSQSSTYKQSLLSLKPGDKIVASQLAGDFVLNKDKMQKMVFIAGGIGITPFGSILKFLIDTNQSRPITLFYAVRSPQDVVYSDILSTAVKLLGIRVVYLLTSATEPVLEWSGKIGRITTEMLAEEVPDYQQRIFYLSGPPSMVDAYKKTLLKMGIRRTKIKTDYFPGFA